MLENPQNLIRNIYIKPPIHVKKSKTAIFIPYKDNINNLKELITNLTNLNIDIPIFIFSNINNIRITINNNVKIINIKHLSENKFIRSLNTFRFANKFKPKNWDLPLKRNLMLFFAKNNLFDKVLFIDDDIFKINKNILKKGFISLDKLNLTGCLIKNFPDTSVIGHIEHFYGDKYHPFISGSFLFINIKKLNSFFPLIYNEDWLFMIKSILENKIGKFGNIYQKQYNPFENMNRIVMQEFGEIIAEGLFELIYEHDYQNRFNSMFWDKYINYRKSYVNQLLNIAQDKHKIFIYKSLSLANNITSYECLKFIEYWEKDLITINKCFNEK